MSEEQVSQAIDTVFKKSPTDGKNMQGISRKNKEKNFSVMEAALMMKIGTWRHPFIMVDRIIDLKFGARPKIVSIKNVTANEPQFLGHFPDFPVMPGVMIAEGFGQTSEYMNLILEFSELYLKKTGEELKDRVAVRDAIQSEYGMALMEDLRKRTVGFLASQDLKYKEVVVPGDQIEFHSEIILSERGFNHFKVEAFVGKKLVCSGRISNWRNIADEKDPVIPDTPES